MVRFKMKYSLLVLIVLMLFVAFAPAQTFTWQADVTTLYGSPGDIIAFHTYLKNVSPNTITLRIVRFSVNMPADWSSSFCVGSSCYSPFVDTVEVDILPDSTDELIIDMYTGSSPDVGILQVKVENVSNPADSIRKQFVGSTGPNSIAHKRIAVSGSFALYQNYPNPFNPDTHIMFEVGQATRGRTSLIIYNVLGQPVRVLVNQALSAGIHTVRWDGRDDKGNAVPSGLYFYRLQNGSHVLTGKMILMK